MRERCRSLLLRILLLSGLACLPTVASALQPDLGSLNALPLHTAPATVVAKAMQQVNSKSRPLKFAVHATLPLTLADGVWDEPEAGVSRWRTRIASNGALGLALNFSRFQLPPGAELWFYDDAGRAVQGPYTQADENSQNKLWTALVPGASAVIELRSPIASRDAVQLELGDVSHAFIDISKAATVVPAKSESCNVDVVCSDGDAWRNQIRSVALITIGGDTVCSGELLNNQRRDRDPLFITANHCEISSSSIAASVVFYWNYQTAVCGGTPSNSLNQNQSGSTLLAGNVGADFSLLRLSRTPDKSFKVYYSGWDATLSAPQSGVAIHHPEGDDKRISTYTRAAVQESVCIDDSDSRTCQRRVDAWRVNWTRGSTAPGSSGGGLWNQNGRLVGTLSGGSASCSSPNGDDFFARLAAGFTAGSTANSQLKVWLDPDSTGTTGIDGLDSSGSTSSGTGNDSSSLSSGGGGAASPLLIIVFAFGGLLRWLLAPQRTPCMPRRSRGANNSNSTPLPSPAAAIKPNRLL